MKSAYTHRHTFLSTKADGAQLIDWQKRERQLVLDRKSKKQKPGSLAAWHLANYQRHGESE